MRNRWLIGAMVLTAVCAGLSGCKKPARETPQAQTETRTESAGPTESETDHETERGAGDDMESSHEESTTFEEDSQVQREYIFPESHMRILTGDELEQVSPDQLRFARNEIFARRGRLFTSPELQAYFESKSWYKGTVKPEDFTDDMLNRFEKENINLIKAREDMGDILDAAGRCRNAMEENMNGLFGSSRLLKYGCLNVSMSGGYTEFFPVLKDMGGYYQAPDQVLAVPIYYEWDFIRNVKPGDKFIFSFGWDEETVYTVTDILQEHGTDARVISVTSSGDNWETPMVFTDAFGNGKYVLAMVDDLVGDSYTLWNSDDISCACRIVYKGNFYVSKDCVIDVGGEEFSVEDQWELDESRNYFGGAIYGEITEIDANGLITRVVQQIAG